MLLSPAENQKPETRNQKAAARLAFISSFWFLVSGFAHP